MFSWPRVPRTCATPRLRRNLDLRGAGVSAVTIDWKVAAKSFSVQLAREDGPWTTFAAADGNALSSTTLRGASGLAKKVRILMTEPGSAGSGSARPECGAPRVRGLPDCVHGRRSGRKFGRRYAITAVRVVAAPLKMGVMDCAQASRGLRCCFTVLLRVCESVCAGSVARSFQSPWPRRRLRRSQTADARDKFFTQQVAEFDPKASAPVRSAAPLLASAVSDLGAVTADLVAPAAPRTPRKGRAEGRAPEVRKCVADKIRRAGRGCQLPEAGGVPGVASGAG